MKTFILLLSILFISANTVAKADTSKVHLTVKVERENGAKDSDKNTKTPDESRNYWLAVRISNPTALRLEGLTLKWSLYADDLKRGTDHIVVEKSGEQSFAVDAAGRYTDLTTPKVLYSWVPQHSERTGSGRRSSSKKVDESGHRFHGYSLQVLQDGVVIGEACSPISLRKTE